ncbi:MAG: metal-sulfur cluster assembly factor [Hyphomicrobiales bacterium]
MTVPRSGATGADHQNAQESEVWQQLDRVCDPELDEPITDMGFVESVDIDGDRQVAVRFRLPTYWCSANFAYLMASDIRLEVEKLSWVTRVRVRLEDHMFEEQVNTGVNEGLSFRQIFAELAPDESLDEIREKFRKKAFQRRQEVMLLGLQGLGFCNERIVAMTLREFDTVRFSNDDDIRQKARYREIIDELGLARHASDPAFCDYDGRPFRATDLAEYLSKLRGVRINMEFSGALCRGLLGTRYKELDRNSDEPTLVDFMLDRVPPASSLES